MVEAGRDHYVKVDPFLFLQSPKLGHEPLLGAASSSPRHGGCRRRRSAVTLGGYPVGEYVGSESTLREKEELRDGEGQK